MPGSLHFFYLYGGERQAHQSFFKRIYLEIKGQYALQLSGARFCRSANRNAYTPTRRGTYVGFRLVFQ